MVAGRSLTNPTAEDDLPAELGRTVSELDSTRASVSGIVRIQYLQS